MACWLTHAWITCRFFWCFDRFSTHKEVLCSSGKSHYPPQCAPKLDFMLDVEDVEYYTSSCDLIPQTHPLAAQATSEVHIRRTLYGLKCISECSRSAYAPLILGQNPRTFCVPRHAELGGQGDHSIVPAHLLEGRRGKDGLIGSHSW
jgi:hypothetical protein